MSDTIERERALEALDTADHDDEPRFVTLEIIINANVMAPGGANNFEITHEQAMAAMADDLGFAAGLFGLSKAQYLEWLACNGRPYCAYQFADDHHCRNQVRAELDPYGERPVNW